MTFYSSQQRPPDSMRAAEALSKDMAKQLHCYVKPEDLHDWIRERWHIIHHLAHAIHEGQPRVDFMIAADVGSGP